MDNLLNEFMQYAEENKLDYGALARRLETAAIANNKFCSDNYDLSPILARTIKRYADDSRIDTFVAMFSYAGFQLLGNVGAKRVTEMDKVVADLKLEWKKLPTCVTPDTKLIELGMSPTWVETLEKHGVVSVGSFLAHPRISSHNKKVIRKLM